MGRSGLAFPGGIAEAHAARIRYELEIIRQLGYARYFLTVHDIVSFAGARASCARAGLGRQFARLLLHRGHLRRADVMDTLFERFISSERGEPPDIDVDFEHEKREVVIAYIYGKYSESVPRLPPLSSPTVPRSATARSPRRSACPTTSSVRCRVPPGAGPPTVWARRKRRPQAST